MLLISITIHRLPDDIWVVDLDSNKLTAATGSNEEVPALPEPEGTILKNHLKQVCPFSLDWDKDQMKFNFHF